jgi:eukaryotic-like serine/threonine-protein kinase
MMAADDPTEQSPVTRVVPLARQRSQVDPLIGATLGGFRIDAVLGEGGMGVVYRGFDLALERHVAIKTLRIDAAGARVRFHREARLQAKMRHRHVVTLHSVGEHAGLTYIVMDFIAGETLTRILQRDGALPESRALDIADALAAALEAAQARGLIHRDVKPSNVLIERDGNVLLTDFGLAKEVTNRDTPLAMPVAAPADGLTEAGAVLGTPGYLAPETRAGDPVDHRADMYALGVTLHEMLTAQRPKDPVDLDLFRAETGALVARLLAPSSDDRFATYADLRAAIAKIRGSAQPAARRRVGVDVFGLGIMVGLLASLAATLAQIVFGRSMPVSIVLAWPLACLLVGLIEAVRGALQSIEPREERAR